MIRFDPPVLPAWASLLLLGLVLPQLAFAMLADFTERRLPMYIDPGVFLAMLLGDALSIAGLLFGAFALVSLWLRRRPRKRLVKPQVSGIIGPDGRTIR